jgi:putative ubiquitin-RnfH superfamily antitoxin RatB of RatAB toxin-antitoxin module
MSSNIQVDILLSIKARTILTKSISIHPDTNCGQLLDSQEVQNLLSSHEISLNDLRFSCWGQKIALSQVLKSGDRIELCRELRVDPKVARHERFEKQGKRGAGLFSLAGKKKPSSI